MKAEDLDNDGRLDFIMGNRGLNSSIKGNIYEPCTIYAKDFDNNGSYDAILGYYNQDKCYPLYSRDQLIDQVPSMRKKFVRYHDYAGKTMDDIERWAIEETLRMTAGNREEAAKILDIGARTLYRKLDKYRQD